MSNEESFLGLRIIELKDQQEIVLREIHETTIAKKLRLGSNFSRETLYSRKNILGIALIKPKKEVEMLACKLYIGNVRANTKICKIIRK